MTIEGARVYVHHLRRYPGHLPYYMNRTEAAVFAPGEKPAAKGGITLVQVEYDDGRTVRGASRCSNRDNFCKAIGRQIALGRALKSAEVNG